MSGRNMFVGMPICPNGNTIYCTEKHPCDGCMRRAKALNDLRRYFQKLRPSAEQKRRWREAGAKELDAVITKAITKGDLHMSWSASVSNVTAEDAIGDLQDNFAKTNPSPSPEVAEQFAAAIEAVGAVLKSVQPDKNGRVTVSASGHANPGHQKTPGWSNDTFSLSIYQV